MLRLILLTPLLILLALFALSNTTTVSIELWPTGLAIDAPLSVAILIGMAGAFLLGACLVWFGSLADRRRARRAEQKARSLQVELDRLRQAPLAARPTLTLPAPQ